MPEAHDQHVNDIGNVWRCLLYTSKTFSYSIEKDGRKLLILVNLGDQEWTYRLKQSARLAIAYPHVYGRKQELSQEEFTVLAHGWILVEQA